MSLAQRQAQPDVGSKNEWTIMVFFAGNKDLSPSMTSQLKAIKDAGFQKNTTVLIHFDPNERGTGTMTFEVNRLRKTEAETIIGDGKNPFVRNLLEDRVPGAPKSATALEALQKFLDLGLREHKAEHYMVFLVGHGVVVGNDSFLPDHHPGETAITLKDLGACFSDFSRGVKLRGGSVDLIGLHSCSMSAIEVAYELKDSAKYLMATEGVSFVGSWPYRQMLKKTLNTIDVAKQEGYEVDVDELVLSLQGLALHNSTDFMFSGLSADLCLCRLDGKRVDDLTAPIKRLAKALKEGLKSERGRELISLAHLKAQSYWQETYTDLYDFCQCLEPKCDTGDGAQNEMKIACEKVRAKLEESTNPGSFIVESDHFGPLFQYSHGVSIYFPWSQPVEDVPLVQNDDILGRYRDYKFTRELGDDSWLSFLEVYFEKTRRDTREKEDGTVIVVSDPAVTTNGNKPGAIPATVMASSVGAGGSGGGGGGGFGVDSLPIDFDGKVSPALDLKVSPPLGGGACSCSIKNYPMGFSHSPRAFENANPEVPDAKSAATLVKEAVSARW